MGSVRRVAPSPAVQATQPAKVHDVEYVAYNDPDPIFMRLEIARLKARLQEVERVYDETVETLERERSMHLEYQGHLASQMLQEFTRLRAEVEKTRQNERAHALQELDRVRAEAAAHLESVRNEFEQERCEAAVHLERIRAECAQERALASEELFRTKTDLNRQIMDACSDAHAESCKLIECIRTHVSLWNALHESLCCPLILEVPLEPAITDYGHCFDLASVSAHVRLSGSCPITRQALVGHQIRPVLYGLQSAFRIVRRGAAFAGVGAHE